VWVDTTFVSQRLPAAGFVVCTHLTYEIDRSLGCSRDDHAAAADPARWTSGIPEDELMWQHVLRHHRARGNQAVFALAARLDANYSLTWSRCLYHRGGYKLPTVTFQSSDTGSFPVSNLCRSERAGGVSALEYAA
jgi:hypothetical protein